MAAGLGLYAATVALELPRRVCARLALRAPRRHARLLAGGGDRRSMGRLPGHRRGRLPARVVATWPSRGRGTGGGGAGAPAAASRPRASARPLMTPSPTSPRAPERAAPGPGSCSIPPSRPPRCANGGDAHPRAARDARRAERRARQRARARPTRSTADSPKRSTAWSCGPARSCLPAASSAASCARRSFWPAAPIPAGARRRVGRLLARPGIRRGLLRRRPRRRR